jgi:hypothetical protein
MHASMDVENETLIEMPLEHVIRECIEVLPEAWTQAHFVCRDHRQHSTRWWSMW